jgi:YD repeat-containing protein
MSSVKRTFYPSRGRRITTICSPVIIFGLTALFPLLGGVVPTGRRSEIDVEGVARLVAAGLLIATGIALAIRNGQVGITYTREGVTVVNGFRTVRIPTRQVGHYQWTEQGLLVAWHDPAGGLRHTPVDAFHRARNPMADLRHGQGVHRELEALRAGTQRGDVGQDIDRPA